MIFQLLSEDKAFLHRALKETIIAVGINRKQRREVMRLVSKLTPGMSRIYLRAAERNIILDWLYRLMDAAKTRQDDNFEFKCNRIIRALLNPCKSLHH